MTFWDPRFRPFPFLNINWKEVTMIFKEKSIYTILMKKQSQIALKYR